MTGLDPEEVMGYQRPRIFHAADAPSEEERRKLGPNFPELGAMGREVRDLAMVAGLELDDWQCWVMEQACEVRKQTYYNRYTKRREPKWAAFEVALVVQRQSGKGSCLEARELAGLFLFGERLLIHSAHLFPTSLEAFNRIMTLIESTPELDAEVSKVSRTHGSEGILLKSKQRLLFQARTGTSGRGFTGDCLIWDEAMILSDTMVGAQMPMLSARPNSQIWYTGSAGTKQSTQFGRVRNRALKALEHPESEPRLFFAEWSINPHTDFCADDCTEHDRSKRVDPAAPKEVREAQRAALLDSYAKANPGLGIRISVEHVEAEHRSMDTEEFDRERLGVGDWPGDGEEWLVIPEEPWKRQADQNSFIDGGFVLGISVSPDQKFSCIVAAGQNPDGDAHVEITGSGNIYDHKPGTGWILGAVKGIIENEWPLGVVINKATFAGSLEDDLVELGLNVLTPSTREIAQGCGDFVSAVCPRPGEQASMVHLGQPALTRAVAGADKRDLAEMWGWDKRSSSVDISPLCAATEALWGFRKLSGGAEPWIMYA